MIHMKCQDLISMNKKLLEYCLLQILLGALRGEMSSGNSLIKIKG